MNVTATRLADRPEPAREVPASTAVITREEIEGSGARTVQEILSRVAGAIFFDQIGNGIQTTFDLRGFSGAGITVLVDGARINDPRNNSVLLETILPDSIDRIEITRGAAAATVGGGSAAGVVNIVTRAGSGPAAVAVTGATGTFATRRFGFGFSGRVPIGGAVSNGSWQSSAKTREADPGYRADDLRGRGSDPGDRGADSGGRVADTDGRGADPGDRADDPGDRGAALSGRGAYGADTSQNEHGIDWLLIGRRDRTDGFRDNADGKLDRIAAGIGYTFEGGSRLSLDIHSADDDLGAPGALTLSEWKDDPSQAPFNRIDGSDVTYRQGTVNWRGALAGPFSLAGNVSYLSRDSTALTTGRAAAAGFGGFLLDARVRTAGGAVQSSAVFSTGTIEHALTFGGEGAGGTSNADGCGTRTSDLGDCDPSSFLNSSNRTRRRDLAFFAQDSLSLGAGVTLLAGGRWDRSRFDYREEAPNPSNDRNRSFSETSWKGGIAWNPAVAIGLYASYGESFQPPTVEDLFAFPGFGSNPDLDPVDAKNYEVGIRGVLAGRAAAKRQVASRNGGSAGAGFNPRLGYSLSVFRTNLSNEIVFDPTPVPGSPFGRNVNAGRSRREGIELTGDWKIFRWLSWNFAYARTRAVFDNGPNDGNEVPLVPKNRYSETTMVYLPRAIDLRVDLLHVGKQVLSNDDANAQQRLDGYVVVDARASWRPLGEPRGAAPGRVINEVEVFLEGRNLFDRRYATRGIYALDFTTFQNTIFVTPAPGRTLVGGASVTF